MASTKLQWLLSDHALMTVCAVGAIVCGSMATLYRPTFVSEAKGESIAIISEKIAKVKRKPSDALVWNDLGAQDALYAGDQIFTDQEATAKVRFGDGSEINVSENSLITIERVGDQTTIDMSKGFISGQLGAGSGSASSNFTIKMGKTNVALTQGSQIQIQVDPANKNINKVALVSGSAEIRGTDGKSVSLAEDQVFAINKSTGSSEIKAVKVKLLSPADQSTSFLEERDVVTFGWQLLSSLPAQATLLVAKDAGFSEVVINRAVTKTRLAVRSLTGGTYFWKIRTADGEESLSRRLRVVSLQAPVTSVPPSGKVFAVVPGRPVPQTSLLWTADAGFATFEVQLARDAGFRDLAIDRTVTSPSLVTSPLPAGKYYWRVRAVGDKDKKTAFSRVASFEVSVPILPKPPKIREPAHRSVVAASDVEQVKFSFDKSVGATGYELHIAKDAEFSSLLLSESSPNPFLTWRPVEAGTYYWRVRSVDRFERETEFSRPQTIIVKVGAAKPLTPEADQTLVWDLENMSVPFLWSAVPGADRYILEVASDRQFEDKVLRQRVETPDFTWRAMKPGTYFWRVLTVQETAPQKSASVSSVTRQFQVQALEKLQPPQLKDQYYFRLRPPTDGSAWRSIKKWWAQFGTAYAATIDGDRVIIEWEPVSGAQTYRLELATDRDFQDVVESTDTTSARFLWREATPGRYFLRARSVDTLGTAGSYSRTSTVVVTYEAPRLYAPMAGFQHQLKDDDDSVAMRWQSIPGTRSYRLQIAQDPAFKTPIIEQSLKRARYQWQQPTAGKWYWRVGALYATGIPWEWSPAVSFDVVAQAKPEVVIPITLAPPQWTSPTDGQEFSFLNNKRPVRLQWEKIETAASYQLKVSGPGDEEESRLYKTLSNEGSVPGLKAGSYVALVRAVDDAGIPGDWSEPRSFSRVLQKIDAPEPIFPENGEELARRSKLVMRWQKELGFDGYRLVLSRDKEFKNVVGKKLLKGDRATMPLPDPGSYYWYIEGKNKQQNYAMRSDVQTFKVSKYTGAASEEVRILAALSPSLISNTMVGTSVTTNTQIGNSLSVTALTSFVLEGQYWFGSSFGGEVGYHYKATNLFESSEKDPSSDQEVLAYDPQELSARLLYRNPFSIRPGAVELLGRAGYLYKSFFSYFAKSRTALGLVETDTHNLSLGLGGKIPMSGKNYIETGFDFNFPFASSGTEVASASYIRFDAGYYLQYSSAIRGGFAYRYGRGSYEFSDVTNGIEGTLLESTHSLMASLGYGF